MAVHGDITEVRFSHPDLGSGAFFPKANEGNTYDPGGFRNEDDTNGLAGNGDLIVKKSRTIGFFEITVEDDNVGRKDAQIAAALAKSSKNATYTFSCINGSVWSCSGVVVGDIQPDVSTGLFKLKVNTGNMKQQ